MADEIDGINIDARRGNAFGLVEDNTAGSQETAARRPRPRGAVSGGWGFDDKNANAGAAAKLRADTPSPSNDVAPSKGHFDGDDDVVPTIPDLEEEAEEDITRQVAAPPPSMSVVSPALTRPIRAVREMEINSGACAVQLPASPEEGVDLAPLMQCLCSEQKVFEQDVTWDYDLIFQEVASAINSDMIMAEGGGGEDNNPVDFDAQP